MADTDQEQSQKHKDHSSEKSIEPRNDTDNSPKHREDASAPNQACRYEAQQPPNIIIQRDKPDDTQAVRANTIANRMFIASIAGSIISLGVLVATFFIWKATQDSVQVAHDALADSHTKDSTASVNEKVAQGRQNELKDSNFIVFNELQHTAFFVHRAVRRPYVKSNFINSKVRNLLIRGLKISNLRLHGRQYN